MGSEQILISWSGERSRSIAEALANWLPLVLERPRLWISSRDVPEGTRWTSELSRILDQSQFGIFVITRENTASPWILFEAGALSKHTEVGRVIPYLVGLDIGYLTGPLAQFQAIEANHDGTWSMVRTIALLNGYEVSEQVIRRRFDAFWPELQRCLNEALAKPSGGAISQESPRDVDPLIDVRKQLSEVKELIRQLVSAWLPSSSIKASVGNNKDQLSALQGAWITETDTHIYARMINGDLLAPYCYGGDIGLTAYYYGWKRIGKYWFARFQWVHENLSGFTFLQERADDVLEGAWWYDREFKETPQTPIESGGVRSRWLRQGNAVFPFWAEALFRQDQ